MTVDTEYLEGNGTWYTNTPVAVAEWDLHRFLVISFNILADPLPLQP